MSKSRKSLQSESPEARGQGEQGAHFNFQIANPNPRSQSFAAPSDGSEASAAFFPGWLNSLFDQEDK